MYHRFGTLIFTVYGYTFTIQSVNHAMQKPHPTYCVITTWVIHTLVIEHVTSKRIGLYFESSVSHAMQKPHPTIHSLGTHGIIDLELQ